MRSDMAPTAMLIGLLSGSPSLKNWRVRITPLLDVIGLGSAAARAMTEKEARMLKVFIVGVWLEGVEFWSFGDWVVEWMVDEMIIVVWMLCFVLRTGGCG